MLVLVDTATSNIKWFRLNHTGTTFMIAMGRNILFMSIPAVCSTKVNASIEWGGVKDSHGIN